MIKGKGVVIVAGKIQWGAIHDKAEVLITDETGKVLQKTTLIDLDWFDRSRYGEHVTADKGMNIALIFPLKDKDYLRKGHNIVIR
ncbi:hypothetical protein QA584_24095 [Anaerocolumna sp. AGMB13025]|uniref:hypothetical protein n=1 Tax=Anaerocolumna sp. AGMB13025 TaxID=3039116 RepID=UPI00241F3B72|nr:hypothetical protein [Anaerocolumna sp. AGMB13025]WFR56662.1 hypothetical protein QA584_24095 [Anaerocolumna sp. AGMB13025]